MVEFSVGLSLLLSHYHTILLSRFLLVLVQRLNNHCTLTRCKFHTLVPIIPCSTSIQSLLHLIGRDRSRRGLVLDQHWCVLGAQDLLIGYIVLCEDVIPAFMIIYFFDAFAT